MCGYVHLILAAPVVWQQVVKNVVNGHHTDEPVFGINYRKRNQVVVG
jgi:hypothetical protein